MNAKTCSVCHGDCPQGSKVWAIRIVRRIALNPFSQSVVVCHLDCKNKLSPEDGGPE